MDILCIIPPQIPSYFNAGHHLGVFSVAAYLRKNLSATKVVAMDAAALNMSWKNICDILVKQPRMIALMNDFDGIDTFERFLTYVKKLSPQSRVITFGRLSNQIPKFFLQYDLDAILCSGDYENGVLNFWHAINNNKSESPGALLKAHPDNIPALGSFIESENWVLPDITEIPYKAYSEVYLNDLNKFCGIPERLELVVPVARGCPINCFFCDVPKMQGKRERRLSVATTIDYIVNSFETLPFEYVSFYSPTFTLNKLWVFELCDALLKLDKLYPWKCTTALSCLDEEIVRKMASAGCLRISLGIESTTAGAKKLPKSKQDIKEKFLHITAITKEVGIELNAFLILGLPGDDPESVKQTFEYCMHEGIRVRPAIYTPYHEMSDKLTPHKASTYNRQTFVDNLLSEEEIQKYYALFYMNEIDQPTQVMHKIARRSKSTNTLPKELSL